MSSHSDGSAKAIFYALGTNGGIALAKFGAAFYTGAGAGQCDQRSRGEPADALAASQMVLLRADFETAKE